MNDSVLNVITYAAIWTLKINRKVSQVTPRRIFNILADEVDDERKDKKQKRLLGDREVVEEKTNEKE